ncbi:nanos homolog 3 isoform X2 [Hemicordylus capensis]|uniref:nanos homolog 3 isoform X2 n=1 Tax=Hemicordylus capensis TaxID=884348 RepID=UPI002304256C|nr:nanos homolog 3 isoform X2 [Hemicordylus capensis]
MTAFQVWKDYLQLAKVVEEIRRGEDERRSEEAPELCFAPAQPASAAPAPAQELPEGPSRGEEGAAEEEGAVCSFCKHNGESRNIYTSHKLKDAAGRVQCPILRNYVCPQCGASKDLAHTKRFCPLTKKGYTSVYTSCSRNSAGKRRERFNGNKNV